MYTVRDTSYLCGFVEFSIVPAWISQQKPQNDSKEIHRTTICANGVVASDNVIIRKGFQLA